MAQEAQRDSLAEAIEWHIRLRDDRPEAWEGFVLWLEGDPARSDAYDAVALADAGIEAGMAPPAMAASTSRENPHSVWTRATRGTWGRWATALAAVAAALLFGLIATPWLTSGPSRYTVTTAAGEQKIVSIGSEGSVALNGGTRLILDRKDSRYAELAAGEATFTVRHDAARPFVVVSGNHRVQDVGTVFNLVRDRGRFAVEVVEGAVVYNPEGEAVPLSAGQTLAVLAGGQRPVVGSKDPKMMAGWRHGQLSFAGAPLALVAGDVARSIGAEVELDPGIADAPFTGSVRVGSDDAATVRGLASTLGYEARRTAGGWRIEPLQRASR